MTFCYLSAADVLYDFCPSSTYNTNFSSLRRNPYIRPNSLCDRNKIYIYNYQAED